jgi:hypothetical protein
MIVYHMLRDGTYYRDLGPEYSRDRGGGYGEATAKALPHAISKLAGRAREIVSEYDYTVVPFSIWLRFADLIVWRFQHSAEGLGRGKTESEQVRWPTTISDPTEHAIPSQSWPG